MKYNIKNKSIKNIDWDFIAKMLAGTIFIILILLAIAKIVIFTYTTISEQMEKREEAKVVNMHLEELYKQGEIMGLEVVEDIEKLKLKRMYEQEELDEQKKVILKYETEITKKKMPYGTCVMLDDIRTPVKVVGNYGYQLITDEGINFMLTDDNYYTISTHQYRLLKDYN